MSPLMDRPLQDHQDQNPGCQKQMEGLGGDQGPPQAPDQDPRGALGRGEDNHTNAVYSLRFPIWKLIKINFCVHKPADVSQPDRDQPGANQEAAPESGGGVPSLLISGAAEQVSRDRSPMGARSLSFTFPGFAAPPPPGPKFPSLFGRSRAPSSALFFV